MTLWLDDKRPAPPNWVWARSYDEAVYFCGGIDFSEVSLDHDLGEGRSGYDFLCFLEERFVEGGRMPAVAIHTANPVGRERMLSALRAMSRRAGILAAPGWSASTPDNYGAGSAPRFRPSAVYSPLQLGVDPFRGLVPPLHRERLPSALRRDRLRTARLAAACFGLASGVALCSAI